MTELLTELDNVPLAVVLMAHVGQKGDSPKQLLKWWKEEHTSFLSYHMQNPSCLSSIEVSIRVSLQSHSMAANPEALQLLSLISLLPAGVLNGQLPAMVPSLSRPNEASNVLRGTALAYYNKKGTLHVLSPIWSYMLVCHPPSKAMVKHLEYYYCKLAKLGSSEPGNQDYKVASQTLQKVEGNMEAVLMQALTYHPDCHIIQGGLDFTRFLYWIKPRTTIICIAAQVAKDLKQSESEARCLQSLGETLRMQDNYNEAKIALTKAKAQFGIIGSQRGTAQCLQSLGDILMLQNKYDEASMALTGAKVQFETIDSQLGTAQCL